MKDWLAVVLMLVAIVVVFGLSRIIPCEAYRYTSAVPGRCISYYAGGR